MHQPDLPSLPPEAEDVAPALAASSAGAFSSGAPTFGFTPTASAQPIGVLASSTASASEAAGLRASSPISFLSPPLDGQVAPPAPLNPIPPNSSPSQPTASLPAPFTFGAGPTAGEGSHAAQASASVSTPAPFTFGAGPTTGMGTHSAGSETNPTAAGAAADGKSSAEGPTDTHQPSQSAIDAAQSLLFGFQVGGQPSQQLPQQPQVTAAGFRSATNGLGTPGPSVPGILNGPTLQQGAPPESSTVAALGTHSAAGAAASSASLQWAGFQPAAAANGQPMSQAGASAGQSGHPLAASTAAAAVGVPSQMGGVPSAASGAVVNPFAGPSSAALSASNLQLGSSSVGGAHKGGFSFGSSAAAGTSASQPAPAGAGALPAAASPGFTFGSTSTGRLVQFQLKQCRVSLKLCHLTFCTRGCVWHVHMLILVCARLLDAKGSRGSSLQKPAVEAHSFSCHLSNHSMADSMLPKLCGKACHEQT